MQITGFIVNKTEKALAIVLAADAAIVGVRPLWAPLGKIDGLVELDSASVKIETAQNGTAIGTPVTFNLDDVFAAKVGLA